MVWALRITSIASAAETWTNRIGTSSNCDSVDGAVCRFALGEARVADGVITRRAETAFEQPAGQPFDHVVVLGMNHDERALAPRHRQDVEHLPVIELEQVIGHVDLERGVAVADQRRQFLAHHLLGRVGDDQMKRIIDHRLGPGRLVVLLDDPAQRLPPMLRGERDHRRRAAKRRRDGRAVEIIGADDPSRGALLDMAMAVNAAGQDQLPARIDLACSRAEIFAERRDHATLDAYVANRRVGRRRDGAAADYKIVFAHAAPLLLPIGRAVL